MQDDQGTAKPTRRPRSPGYPFIDLEKAVGRVRALYDSEGSHAAPLSAAFSAWGYESLSGDGNLVASALKKFGLVEYEGTGKARRLKVTPLALRILEHPDPEVRKQSIAEAALNPAIHRELWEKHRLSGGLPSDETLRWELVHERNFTKTGAADFIPEYRSTVSFAGLDEKIVEAGSTPQSSATEPPLEDDQVTADTDGQAEGVDRAGLDPAAAGTSRSETPSDRPPSTGTATYALPVAPNVNVTVEGRFPLTDSEWDQFMAVLQAMKPALTVPADPHS